MKPLSDLGLFRDLFNLKDKIVLIVAANRNYVLNILPGFPILPI